MSRATLPVMICDSEDGCGEYVEDYYETCADSVGGIRITWTERAPGWYSADDEDFCPYHKPNQSNGSQ